MKKFLAHSQKETEEFAKKFSSVLKNGDTVLLFGEMGSGKTTFSKYLLKALGYGGVVTSPTFALVNVYDSKIPVQHFDMYRLESIGEAVEAGIDEMLKDKKFLNIVEWPEKVIPLLPKKAIILTIKAIDANTREFVVEGIK